SRVPPRRPGNGYGYGRGGRKGETPVTLDPDQSAALRKKLLTELGNITSANRAAAWAREALSAKNSLTASDAKLVENAFERRLSELPSSEPAAPSNDDPSVPQIAAPQVIATADSSDSAHPKGIDKSILMVAAPRRYRNREHLVMWPNKRVSSADANNPIRIIFATCNRGRSAAKPATNSPSRSAARITAPSIAPGTSRPGGSPPVSTPLRSPVSSGDKPGSMIRNRITSRVSRRARRLHQLPRPLTVGGSRGPIRLP